MGGGEVRPRGPFQSRRRALSDTGDGSGARGLGAGGPAEERALGRGTTARRGPAAQSRLRHERPWGLPNEGGDAPLRRGPLKPLGDQGRPQPRGTGRGLTTTPSPDPWPSEGCPWAPKDPKG